MTYLLSIDPGLNTGIVLGFYDAVTPYRVLERWQVHHGPAGFIQWFESARGTRVDEIVVEKFIYDASADAADIIGVPIEGMCMLIAHERGIPVIWQTRADKGALVGYPDAAVTKAQRQRVRFDFLDRIGMFKPGTENDDTNDAVTHALVSLRRRRHIPTLKAYWKGAPSSSNAVVAMRSS